MANAADIVNTFLQRTSARDIRGAMALLRDDVEFIGPLMRTSGASAYAGLLEQFLPAHIATRILKQFQDGDDVCSVNELDIRTPTGGTLTIAMAEWFRLRSGKIAEHRVYYDPREFARAFGLPSER